MIHLDRSSPFAAIPQLLISLILGLVVAGRSVFETPSYAAKIDAAIAWILPEVLAQLGWIVKDTKDGPKLSPKYSFVISPA